MIHIYIYLHNNQHIQYSHYSTTIKQHIYTIGRHRSRRPRRVPVCGRPDCRVHSRRTSISLLTISCGRPEPYADIRPAHLSLVNIYITYGYFRSYTVFLNIKYMPCHNIHKYVFSLLVDGITTEKCSRIRFQI